MTAEPALIRRRQEQLALINRAEKFVAGLPADLGVRAAVVFGSVARGDFNLWSDVDVVVVAEHLPARLLDRLDALTPRPARVQPVPWTPAEWAHHASRGNPIVVEARERGLWLVGAAAELERLTSR